MLLDHQWLQFDVGPPKLVAGIVTKGRGDKKHWVTRYRLSYSNDSLQWHFYSDHVHRNAVAVYSILFYSIPFILNQTTIGCIHKKHTNHTYTNKIKENLHYRKQKKEKKMA